MAEYINKKYALMGMCETCNGECEECLLKCDYYDAVSELPTIDIVHCSECKYAEPHECFSVSRQETIYGVGCRKSGQHPADWFCADGERKTPPVVTDEITELNEENNKLFKENEKLKAKLYEINCISHLSVLEEMDECSTTEKERNNS